MVKSVCELKKAVGVEIASIILTMLEKPTQRRFSSWLDIENKFESEASGMPEEMSEIVDFAISQKISKDAEAQKRREEEERERTMGSSPIFFLAALMPAISP